MTRPRVWFEREILPDHQPEVDEVLERLVPTQPDDPFAGLADARGIVAGTLIYDAQMMDRAPHALVIARTGIGVDTVDIPEATTRGIAVCNAPDGPTISTAEHAVGLMLAVAKSVKRSAADLRDAAGDYYARHDAVELDGKTLGLVGFGRIARRVAGAAIGLGMQVRVYDPYVNHNGFPNSVTRETELASLLATADVVSVHVPLSAETRHMFDTGAFAAMKPGTVFINTARGGLVDHNALLGALEEGRIFGAGLDVTEPEPLPPDHPLLHRPDVIVTPHIASGTHAGKRRIFRATIAQVVQVLNGERPPHLVNPEVWDHVVARRAADGGA